MFEMRDEALDSLHDLLFRERGTGEDGFQFNEERIDLLQRPFLYLLYNSKAAKAIHVQSLARDIEFLVCLFTGRIRAKINDRIFLIVEWHIRSKVLCFFIRRKDFLLTSH